MNPICHQPKHLTDGQLERIIEPLASYISAASRPRAALASAVAVLARSVEDTNHAASAHVATFLDGRWCRTRSQVTQLGRGI